LAVKEHWSITPCILFRQALLGKMMRKTKSAGDEIVIMDRRSTKERRTETAPKAPPKVTKTKALDRTEKRAPNDRRSRDGVPVGMAKVIAEEKRKVKVQRRRQIDPTTCERDYSDDEIVFMQAMDEYKRKNGRMFPTCSEILEVVRSIGYVKVSPAVPTDTQPLD
jgi:hypothetical protein